MMLKKLLYPACPNEGYVELKQWMGEDIKTQVNAARASFGVEIDEVTFTNGLLTVRLNKIVPDHQKKKVYEIAGG